MPLAIVDGGRKIRRTISRRTEIAASFGPAAVGVTSSAKRSRAASEAATTKLPTATKSAITAIGSATTAIGSTTPMVASESSSAATMESAPPSAAAMGTAPSSSAAVTAAATTVLGEGCIWRESKTDENSKCDEGSENTESAHNPYLRSKQRTFERGAHGEGGRAPT